MTKPITILGGITFCAAMALAQSPTVDLKNAQGESVGIAVLSPATSQASGGVSIALDLKNLTPGEHAIHIHQNAKCDPPGFTSAGPHSIRKVRSTVCKMRRGRMPGIWRISRWHRTEP